MLSNTTQLRVRYADTDKMQFVYNGKYLEYFEVGRTELLRAIGLAYREVEEQGYQLPLLEAGLKYINAARYDDLLNITAFIEQIDTAKIELKYEIRRDSNNDLIATGFTNHVFMLLEKQKATRPPKFYLEKLKPYFKKNTGQEK